MSATWAAFAKDPEAGPGWSAIGTAADEDVAVLGGAESAAVKMASQDSLDGRCRVWRDVLVGVDESTR